MTIYELKCFGLHPGSGNPALVVLDDQNDSTARQAFARASQRSACVFLDADGSLDYYYPHQRSPLCLHATLAAARVLLPQAGSSCTVRTALRGQRLQLLHDADAIYVRLQRQPAPAPALTPATVAALLARPDLVPASPPAIASVGSPKLLVEVADVATLQALQPDLAAIAAWGQAHGVNGLYAWAQRPDGSLEGRNFNHLDPAFEDSATGVAAGALTALLQRPLTLYQGAQRGQPCRLRTRLDGTAIDVGGAATFA
jgi:PhzF family phenazine biosynthesis protein